jgi:hypothetical protein
MDQIIYPMTHKTLDLDTTPTNHEIKNINILSQSLRDLRVSLNLHCFTILVFRGTKNPGPGAYSAATELHSNSYQVISKYIRTSTPAIIKPRIHKSPTKHDRVPYY